MHMDSKRTLNVLYNFTENENVTHWTASDQHFLLLPNYLMFLILFILLPTVHRFLSNNVKKLAEKLRNGTIFYIDAFIRFLNRKLQKIYLLNTNFEKQLSKLRRINNIICGSTEMFFLIFFGKLQKWLSKKSCPLEYGIAHENYCNKYEDTEYNEKDNKNNNTKTNNIEKEPRQFLIISEEIEKNNDKKRLMDQQQKHNIGGVEKSRRCSYNCSCYCCVMGCCIETSCWQCCSLEHFAVDCIICNAKKLYTFLQLSRSKNEIVDIDTIQTLATKLETKQSSYGRPVRKKLKNVTHSKKRLSSSKTEQRSLKHFIEQIQKPLLSNCNINCCYCSLNIITLSFHTFGKDICQKLFSLCSYYRKHLLTGLFILVPSAKQTSSYNAVVRFKTQLCHQSMTVNLARNVLTENRKHIVSHTSLKANDQQLKTKNLCKMFCNNRRCHRRRKRRRRHRCVTHIEQQKHNQTTQAQGQFLANSCDINITLFNDILWNLRNFSNAKGLKTITNSLVSSQASDASPATLNLLITATTTFRTDLLIGSKSFKRRTKTNLVWLLISLVWFDNQRYANCISLTSSSAQATKSLSQPIAKSYNNTSSAFVNKPAKPIINQSSENNSWDAAAITKHEKLFKRSSLTVNGEITAADYKSNNLRRLTPTIKVREASLEYTNENNAQSDKIRLESIKQQILSRLGLTRKPNVLNPLPQQYIWETLYRADGISSVTDFGDNAKPSSELIRFATSASIMKNRFEANYHGAYAGDIINNTYTQTHYNSRKRSKTYSRYNDNSNSHSKNNIYLGNIQTFDGDATDRNIHYVDDQSGPYMEQEDFFEQNEFIGKTQEIITFGEKGHMYMHHRLVEFAQQSNEISGQQLNIRKAEIHMKIVKISTKKTKPVLETTHYNQLFKRTLKVWIFEITETNHTKKVFDHDARLCGRFEVDTRFLGWKKFDITVAVKNWYEVRKREKLRLLIDCTGCNQQYKIVLFDKNKFYKLNAKQSAANFSEGFWEAGILSIINKTELNKPSKAQNHKNFNWQKLLNTKPESASPESLEKMNLNYEHENILNRPFLVMHTEAKRPRRVRRRTVDCIGALYGQCCKESFYVSFKALGWDDWIIAPRGYFANYCRGDCTGPFRTPDTFQTFHAHFIEEYRKMGRLNGMKPCCAPVKFSSMSLIYYGEDGIIKRDLPKMVVDECGCP